MPGSPVLRVKVRPNRQNSSKDGWDKFDIVLKSIGAALTAVSVAGVGFFGARYLTHRQEAESNVRLYTELMSKREESDSSLRKDMFNSIILNILKPEPTNLDQKVLNLELLASNFHESLDLAPLFRDVRQQIIESSIITKEHADRLVKRLETTNREIVDKQIASLLEGGGKIDVTIDLDELSNNPNGLKVVSQDFGDPYQDDPDDSEAQKKTVTIEVLSCDSKKKEFLLRLDVRTAGRLDADNTLRVGFFNFPMLSNTRLSTGQRCAIILRDYGEISAELTFVYFPGYRASLKEKPYYDEILSDLLRARNRPRASQASE